MRKIMILTMLLPLVQLVKAQQLTGFWYSPDSTRIYEITKRSPDEYSAVIRSSTRKIDNVGFEVIKKLRYNKRKKRFEGFIYSTEDNSVAFVKIRFNRSDPDKIVLCLSRMFVFNVAFNWRRAVLT
jgi:hypothetical protein